MKECICKPMTHQRRSLHWHPTCGEFPFGMTRFFLVSIASIDQTIKLQFFVYSCGKQGRIQAGPAGPFGPGLSLKRGPPFGVIYTTYFFVVTVNIFRKNFHETDFGYDISNTLNISSGIALE